MRLTEEARRTSTLFEPIQINAGLRADNLAEAYYQDPEMDWMIWITNDIIDPYYEWYLNENEFESLIAKKYGSFEQALRKVAYYQNNWAGDDKEISPSFYENNLAREHKKYFTANFGVGNKIISYSRRNEDWVTNTNKIVQYNIVAANTVFVAGDLISLYDPANSVGKGEIVAANTTTAIIQHVSGDLVANSTVLKVLKNQDGLAANSNSYKILVENIKDNEAIFWKAITYYDRESELNENRKNIHVIDAKYVIDVSEDMRLKLKE